MRVSLLAFVGSILVVCMFSHAGFAQGTIQRQVKISNANGNIITLQSDTPTTSFTINLPNNPNPSLTTASLLYGISNGNMAWSSTLGADSGYVMQLTRSGTRLVPGWSNLNNLGYVSSGEPILTFANDNGSLTNNRVFSVGSGLSITNSGADNGSLIIGNTGVLKLTAGSGISLSDSTGNIVISSSSTGVTGTGTATRVAFWGPGPGSTSNLMDDTTLYYDNTNKRLSLGAGVSPTSTLHAITSGASTSASTSSTFTNNTTSTTAGITKTGLDVQSTGSWTGTSATNIGLNVNATGGTTNYAALLNGGNVGIGTTTPSQLLQVQNGNLLLSNSTGTAGSLQFQGTGTGVTTLVAGAQGTNSINYVLPISVPTAGQQLTAGSITGTGPYTVAMSWAAAGTGGGGNGIHEEASNGTMNIRRQAAYRTGTAPTVGATGSNDFQALRDASSQNSSGVYSAIGGGSYNTASGENSVVTGGQRNTASGTHTIVSGRDNTASGEYSSIVGGYGLSLQGQQSFGFNAALSAANATVTSPNVAYFGNVDLWLGNTRNTASQLRLYEAQSSTGPFPSGTTNFTSFQAGAQSSDITYTLPTAYPTASGHALTATTTGVLSWTDVSGSSGGNSWLLTGNAGTAAGTNFLGTTDLVDLWFKTNDSRRMVIESDGDVGIGFASPTARLHVRRTDGFNSQRTDVLVVDHDLTNGTTQNGFGSNILYQLQTSASLSAVNAMRDAASIGVQWTEASDNTRSAAMIFSTVNNGGSLSERVRIAPNGYVGVNNSDPVTSMDINGSYATKATTLTLSNGRNDNIAIGNSSFVRIVGPTAPFSISGIANGTNGKRVRLANMTGKDWTVMDSSSFSTVGNRIETNTNSDIIISGPVPILDMIYDSVSNQWLLGTLNANQVIGAVGSIIYKYKLVDETVTSSATLQDDDHLSFNVNAGETWELSGEVQADNNSNNIDIKVAFQLPTGANMRIYTTGIQDAGGNAIQGNGLLTTSNTPKTMQINGGVSTLITFRGIFITGTTGGSVKFRWCQGVSNNSTTTVRSYSYMKLIRVK